MLRPVNRLVLIAPYIPDPEARTSSGLILPVHSSVSPEGIVLSESDNPLYSNQGEVVALPADPPDDIHVGDWVIFSPYAGQVLTMPGRTLLAVPVHQILAIVEDEKDSNAA